MTREEIRARLVRVIARAEARWQAHLATLRPPRAPKRRHVRPPELERHEARRM
jgi:hypothetical protein